MVMEMHLKELAHNVMKPGLCWSQAIMHLVKQCETCISYITYVRTYLFFFMSRNMSMRK